MTYLTYDYLNENITTISKSFSLNENFTRIASSKTKVFLSHRHKDKEIVKKVVGFLSSFSVDTYIDWLDHSMPEITSSQTAENIKEKINESDKVIVLATENSLESKWIPWELGIADVMKGIENVAILPLIKNTKNWSEREYYQIYGAIKKSAYGNWCYFPKAETMGKRLGSWFVNN